MHLSVIVPALNEAASIASTLERLQALRRERHEVIVVDGGSRDGTPTLAESLCDGVLSAPRGRARQMNAGAAAARGDVLWFLHADTLAPARAQDAIQAALANPARCWGRFHVRLTGRAPALRVVERAMNLRSCVSGIATGDQGIFARRTAFEAVGGYPQIDLMEDVALSRRLKALARPVCVSQHLVTSSRRWEERGIARTILLMWGLRLGYALGADPNRLARFYR